MIIKKIIVPKDQLPAITEDGKYHFRFRVITEDASITSAWSSIMSVTGETIATLTGRNPEDAVTEPDIEATNLGMSISWSYAEQLQEEQFDIFLKWSYDNESSYDTDWEYFGSVSGNTTYATPPYSGAQRATHLKARIQIKTDNKRILVDSGYVLLAESITGISTIPRMDGGSIAI